MTTSLEDLAARSVDPTKPLLEVDRLVMRYQVKAGDVSAVEDVTFTVHEGEAVGLVGESGCGKTSVALSLLRLLPDNAKFVSGEIRLDGTDLIALSEEEMRQNRWNDIAMVFQGAMNSWNPVQRVGDQIKEALDTHFPGKMTYAEARHHMAELFRSVGLPAEMLDRYPHEFSGGMRQRAVIAMALSCSPQVIIADEPTTALDVIVQDQILKELKRIQADLGMSIIYISHDIAVIAEVTDSMGVMYAGKLVEFGATRDVFSRPDPSVRISAAPVHPVDHRAAAQARTPRRRAARPAPPALRLSFPPQVPVRHREVHRRRAAARGGSAPGTRWLAGTGKRYPCSRRRSADDRPGNAIADYPGEPSAPPGGEPGEEVPHHPGAVPDSNRLRPRGGRGQLRHRLSARASGWWGSRGAARPPRGGCWSS